jgi:hypothetical protein
VYPAKLSWGLLANHSVVVAVVEHTREGWQFQTEAHRLLRYWQAYSTCLLQLGSFRLHRQTNQANGLHYEGPYSP